MVAHDLACTPGGPRLFQTSACAAGNCPWRQAWTGLPVLHIIAGMTFRERLLATLRAIAPVLTQPGVVVIGSEVPNLLEEDAASTLVVSQDVDIGIEIEHLREVKAALASVQGLEPSAEEPSVWVPHSDDLIEVNFLGIDRKLTDPAASYVFEDAELPLMVFGPLTWMLPGDIITAEGLRIPVAKRSGLIVEKLITERSGVKGDRDLLVVLGLLTHATAADVDEVIEAYTRLAPDLRHWVRSNLTLLSLIEPHANMPDPANFRDQIAALLARLEQRDEGEP